MFAAGAGFARCVRERFFQFLLATPQALFTDALRGARALWSGSASSTPPCERKRRRGGRPAPSAVLAGPLCLIPLVQCFWRCGSSQECRKGAREADERAGVYRRAERGKCEEKPHEAGTRRDAIVEVP